MLSFYQAQTQRLLNDEANSFFSPTDLTAAINQGRFDIARTTECLVGPSPVATIPGVQVYLLNSLVPPLGSGLFQAINVRSIRSVVQGVSTVLEKRPWQWFTNYYLNGPKSAQTGVPVLWSQQTQGNTGAFYFWPLPSGTTAGIAEATWLPIALTTDSDPEAIPIPWTDAVPYFAAYLCLMQAQRLQDAAGVLALYNKFIQSARMGVTPRWLPANFPAPKPLQSSIDTVATMAGPAKAAQHGEGQQ